MIGVLANVAGIIIGSLIGLLIKKGLPKRLAKAMTTATALAVLYIGVDGMTASDNTLVLVLSMIIGAVIGTLLNLDGHIEQLGNGIEKKFAKKEGNVPVAQGFISATLLFCVGAMTIVGALQSGLSGNHETQFTKAILDCISSVVFASTLGWGVMLSAGSVFVLQGAIVLLAQVAAPFLNDYVIAEMTGAGSVLIFALALNMLGVTKTKLMNFVPAIFIPIILCRFM